MVSKIIEVTTFLNIYIKKKKNRIKILIRMSFIRSEKFEKASLRSYFRSVDKPL